MKEVRQISLNGIVFQVEEDGYVVLKKYIENLERYYENKEGGREIIDDIQIRLAELLQEKKNFPEQAITLGDVESVIAIMGYPENFETAPEEGVGFQPENSSKQRKRLYRDPDGALIAGVCSGLSYYFGIDVWIFRIVFICLGILSFGFWALLYLVLWFIIPKAETTTQRYEMKGEKLNVEKIEQKIKEEVNEAGERVKSFFDKNSSKVRDVADRVQPTAKRALGVFARIVGTFLIIFSVITIVIMVTVWFVPISSVFATEKEVSYFCVNELFKIFGLNAIASFLCLLCILLPLILLLFLGISSFMKRRGRTVSSFMLGIFFTWIVLLVFVAVGLSLYVGDKTVHKIHTTEEITVSTKAKTITIKSAPDTQIFRETYRLFGKDFLLASEDHRYIVYGIPYFYDDVVYTNDSNMVVRVYRETGAKKGEVNSLFQVTVNDSVVYIPNTYLINKNYWGEQIKIKLFVPRDKKVVVDEDFPMSTWKREDIMRGYVREDE